VTAPSSDLLEARCHASGALTALARRAFRDARIRTLAFAYLFAIYMYIEPVGYRSAYPTTADRLGFAHAFANDVSIRLFYGFPYDPLTVGGYAAWRGGGTLAIAAALFGVLAAARALRAEEDSGRMELVLAGAVDRGTAFTAALVAIGTGIGLIGFAEAAGCVLAGLPLGDSVLLAASTASVAAVFVGIGAIVSQLAPSRRVALELGCAVVAGFLLLRVVADTSAAAAWVRWLTPLGWAEATRPFTGAQPWILILPVAVTTLLLVGARRIVWRRDIGTGLLAARDSRSPRLRLLSSTTAQALRNERGSLIAWAVGIGAFALITGGTIRASSSSGLSANLRREIAKLGAGSLSTPSGYLGVVFVFFVFAISLFACTQIASARQEEEGEQLETLLALPLSRERWLGGRLLLAAGSAAVLSLGAAVIVWLGAAAQGDHVALVQMLEAGANCLASAVLVLGVGALMYALAPRAGAGITYALASVAFLWYLVGSVLSVPHWLVELTPYAHIGLVPAVPFRVGAALVLAAIGVGAALLALALFRRRDLANA
jgi:ABC-2 type transport system permease protein